MVLNVRGLVYRRAPGQAPVLDGIDLALASGEILCLLGPNGSGKTTSIRMMCGLLTPDSGSGTCLGYDIRRDAAAIKRNVGYMTQRFSFWDDLTIRENLDFTARIYAMADRRAAPPGTHDGLCAAGGWRQRPDTA